MNKLIVLVALLFATTAHGEIVNKLALDFGIGLAPTFVPEAGYNNAKVRFGFETGLSFWEWSEPTFVKVKHIALPSQTTLRLIRVGLASIDHEPVLIFSPVSIMIRDRVYLSTTSGFGKSPYTIFSLSYILVEVLPK